MNDKDNTQKPTTTTTTKPVTNVIDFEKLLKLRRWQQEQLKSDQQTTAIATDSEVLKGVAIMQQLSPEDQRSITAFFTGWLEAELAVSLGVVDDDEDLFEEAPLFDLVQNIYDLASRGCYFCDHSIDPNETEIKPNTYVCMQCELKLANFVTAMGIDPMSFMPGVLAPRTVQKTRIKRKKVNPGGKSLCRPKNSTLH